MADDQDNKDKGGKVYFVYEKARHHRTFHADGAWASTTPKGEIQISFFNDLRPMPQYIVHEVRGEELGKEIEREVAKDAVTRELNVTVVMDAETIKRVIALLTNIHAQLGRENAEIESREIEIKRQADEISKAV